jgi:hypothetical protein
MTLIISILIGMVGATIIIITLVGFVFIIFGIYCLFKKIIESYIL